MLGQTLKQQLEQLQHQVDVHIQAAEDTRKSMDIVLHQNRMLIEQSGSVNTDAQLVINDCLLANFKSIKKGIDSIGKINDTISELTDKYNALVNESKAEPTKT